MKNIFYLSMLILMAVSAGVFAFLHYRKTDGTASVNKVEKIYTIEEIRTFYGYDEMKNVRRIITASTIPGACPQIPTTGLDAIGSIFSNPKPMRKMYSGIWRKTIFVISRSVKKTTLKAGLPESVTQRKWTASRLAAM